MWDVGRRETTPVYIPILLIYEAAYPGKRIIKKKENIYHDLHKALGTGSTEGNGKRQIFQLRDTPFSGWEIPPGCCFTG